MTLEELAAATGLTANDLIGIWDAEASGSTEPTQKLTAQQLAAAVKGLANLIGASDLDSVPTQGSNNAVKSGGVYTAIQQSTATVDEKLRKSVQYTSTTPIDTGIVVSDNNTLKRVRLYNTSLSMPNGSWVQVGTLASGAWVMAINGMFRLSTDSNKAFFIGQYFNVRWDINSGIIYVMQTYSSSTLTVSVNLSVDYF